MKILVCFKIIPDLDQMSPGDYIVDGQMRVDTSFVRTIINCFDESGLEFGLRLSDEAESLSLHLEKSALTVAGEQAELYLKTLNALKYDKTVLISDRDQDIRFTPSSIAGAIAEYVKKNTQDFIIMGKQSSPGNNALTPLFTAEKLGIPFIYNVIDMHVKGDQLLEVVTEEENGTYIQIIKSPAVLIVGNAVITKLRVPTLKDRMNYGKRLIEKLELERSTVDVDLLPSCLRYLNHERKGEMFEGNEALNEFAKRYHSWKEGTFDL